MDIEHGIRRIPLRNENLLLRTPQIRFAATEQFEEPLGIKPCALLAFHGQALLRTPGKFLCWHMVFSAGKCEFSKKLYYTRAPADVNSCFLGHETPLREGHLASKTSSTHSRLRKTIVIRE